LAVFTWRLTDLDLGANYIALILMAGSGVKTLLNLSPLLKLDGYYVLSDYLDVPNLRRRSFHYVGVLLRRLFGGSGTPDLDVSPRERRIYLAYGLLAAAPSLGLLAAGSVKTLGLLMASGQPLALALFVGLLITNVRRRVGRLFGAASDGRPPANAADGAAAAGPPEPAAPGRWPKRRRVLVAVAVGVGVLAEAGPTADSIALARTAVAQAGTRLRYARARLSRNQQLADSGVLTRIDLENSEEQAAMAEHDEAEASRRLAALLHGSRPEEVEQARAEPAGLEAQRAYLETQ